MIALLTIIITIFMVANLGGLIIFFSYDEYFESPKWFEKLATIVKWFFRIEISIIILAIVILLSYEISHTIICNSTDNDYKGCEVKEEQVMINE